MKIFCVGRNYVDHAKELQNEVPDKPVIFLKPSTAYLENNSEVTYPSFTEELHYEGELVLKIGKQGKNIALDEALSYVESVTIGIDFTARDLQNELKNKGLPWEISKAFDESAPAGIFIPYNNQKNFTLYKNGALVQTGNTDNMIFQIPVILEYISRFFTIEKGDLIFTGTPKGVGKVNRGDKFIGMIENDTVLTLYVK